MSDPTRASPPRLIMKSRTPYLLFLTVLELSVALPRLVDASFQILEHLLYVSIDNFSSLVQVNRIEDYVSEELYEHYENIM